MVPENPEKPGGSTTAILIWAIGLQYKPFLWNPEDPLGIHAEKSRAVVVRTAVMYQRSTARVLVRSLAQAEYWPADVSKMGHHHMQDVWFVVVGWTSDRLYGLPEQH